MFQQLVIQISRTLQRIEEFLLATSVLGIAALTITNVISRSLLNVSLAFAEELAQFLIILVCFVGLSYAASKGRHIRMTAIYDNLPRPARKVFMTVITAVTALIMACLTVYSAWYVLAVYQLGGIFPALRVPFYLVYLSAPLGFALAAIQYALAAVRNLTSRDVYLSFEHKDEYEQPLAPEI